MRAAYLYAPRDLRLIDRPTEALGPDDVRIDVAYTGICGTDLHLYGGMLFGNPPPGPRPLGHEYSGRIVEIGSGVTSLTVGDRVTALPNSACFRCAYCRSGRSTVCPNRVRLREGAWAPIVITPAHLVYRLPDSVSDRLAALTEPLACAVRAVDRASITPGDRVCIIGGGPIGLLVLSVARASGAGQIIVSEPHAYRRALATRLGADAVIDPTATEPAAAIAELTDGMGAEVVFEAVGVPQTIEQAIDIAAPGGTVIIVGVTDRDDQARFQPQKIFFKELTIKGSREATFMAERAIRWLNRVDLEPLLTHTFPLDDVQAAVDTALAGLAGKILLQPAAVP